MRSKDTDLLRDYILEARAEMSVAYAKKESLRQSIQDMLTAAVASGDVSSKEQLDEWWSTLDMASKALRGVPFDVWKAMSKKS